MTSVHTTSLKRRRGFTLLELIVVITIIGILGTVVVVKMSGQTESARRAKIKYDLQKIYEVATMIKVQTSYWPESIDEMVDPTDPNTGAQIAGGFEKLPVDPWQNPYEWDPSGEKPVVRCLGRDASPGGDGEDEDLQYPEEENF